MARKISATELATALEAELYSYGVSINAQVQKAVDLEAEELKKEIQRTSPVSKDTKDKDGKIKHKGGRYKKGWKVRRRFDAHHYMVTLHNPKRYNVVHLVEFGRGENHIGARPHIYEAHQKSVASLERRLDDVIGKGVW
ncbi:MAG: HK97 gp10 family phage protein [Oscillospiraceae bacterium]|nr:HK97 gp10 family phage protein [Oscillospiraceae bacterium]